MKKTQVPLTVGIALVLMIGSVPLLTQCQSASQSVTMDGPGMIYFYSPI